MSISHCNVIRLASKMLSHPCGVNARGCGLVLFSLREEMKLMMHAKQESNNSRSLAY